MFQNRKKPTLKTYATTMGKMLVMKKMKSWRSENLRSKSLCTYSKYILYLDFGFKRNFKRSWKNFLLQMWRYHQHRIPDSISGEYSANIWLTIRWTHQLIRFILSALMLLTFWDESFTPLENFAAHDLSLCLGGRDTSRNRWCHPWLW